MVYLVLYGPPTARKAHTMTTADTLRQQADAKNAQYPQYRGHWDGWTLGVMTRKLRGLPKGTPVLLKPGTVWVEVFTDATATAKVSKEFVTVWHPALLGDTSFPANAIRKA